MATSNTHITVCFWTHRGGRFNNGGHKEYLDNITDFQQLLRLPCLMLVNTDDDGNTLPDDEWYVDDGGGNELLHGRDEIEARTGVLDIDGIYDTYVVKDIDDCTEEEWNILLDYYKKGCRMSSSVKDAILANFEMPDDDAERI